jgi:hypothetical protein
LKSVKSSCFGATGYGRSSCCGDGGGKHTRKFAEDASP